MSLSMWFLIVVSFWVVFDGRRTSKATTVLPLEMSTITTVSQKALRNSATRSRCLKRMLKSTVKGFDKSKRLLLNGNVHLKMTEMTMGLVLHSPLTSLKPRLQTHFAPCEVDTMHSSWLVILHVSPAQPEKKRKEKQVQYCQSYYQVTQQSHKLVRKIL